jgi:DNA-directed RNA polymerase subunit RPC12/RpoP
MTCFGTTEAQSFSRNPAALELREGATVAEIHCPGQDLRYWKLDDIYEITCVHCGALIEFFKDDPRRLCKACGQRMLNPRNDMSCAQWCKHAKECLASLGADPPEH